MSANALVKLNEVKRQLDEVRDLQEIVEIRDRAMAMAVYAEAKGAGEAAQKAKEIQLRAERKAGQFLADMPKNKGGRPPKTPDTMTEVSPPTMDEIGIHPRQATRWKTEAIVPDEVFEEYLATNEEPTSKGVYKLGQKIKQAGERQQTAENVIEQIDTELVYRCIVIDPPWPVQKILREERPNQDIFDYPTMTIDEIGNLPIADLADPGGCHVYLWTTHKFLPSAFRLFERWGVKYQCLMTWRKNVGITPFSWMYDTEHVLFGRIGSLKLERLGMRLSFDAKVNGHSVKPDVFYERVITASPGPRLELFGRKQRSGFDVWGNEANG